MYKLTYDSDDNDEVVAPKSPPTAQRSPTSLIDHGSRMKVTATEIKEKPNGESLSPNQKRTKDGGTYQGNGRFYSLFANDNFVTEDPKKKKKTCCVGLKTGLLIATVVILAMAILGLMWVVRGMQVEQRNMQIRISKLEDQHSGTGSSLSSSADTGNNYNVAETAAASFGQPHPGMAGLHPAPPSPNNHLCCQANQVQIDYINKVLQGQSTRFDNVESKLSRHIGITGVRDAEVSRKLGENFVEVKTALSLISGVENNLQKVTELANAAQNLALLTIKDEEMTSEQFDGYLNAIAQTGISHGEVVAFSVVHAMGKPLVIPHSAELANHETSAEFYDIPYNFATSLSFTQEITDGRQYIQPESGIFHVPSDGNYVILMSFCIRDNQVTSVHLMRNEKLLREMEVASETLSASADDETPLVPPPPFAPPPLPVLYAPPPFAEPPLPPTDGSSHIRPYQFTEVVKLEHGDRIYMKIHTGSIVEYSNPPTDDTSAASCTRFSGYKVK